MRSLSQVDSETTVRSSDTSASAQLLTGPRAGRAREAQHGCPGEVRVPLVMRLEVLFPSRPTRSRAFSTRHDAVRSNKVSA